jgi:type I restriction enzyme S subunit
MTALLTDNLPLLASAPNGIKKLRELILELAVRGKLVEQDASDEPASELLKRIAAEKARLLAEGKVKAQSPLPKIPDGEQPYELPVGWEWKRFGEIFALEYGDNLPAPKRSNTGEYPVYGSNGVVGTHSEPFVRSQCVVVGRKGSAGALNLCLADGCCVTDVAYYCVPPTNLSLMYVFKLFHTLGLDSLGKGIKPGLNRNEAYALVVAIPPLAEQHRIVAKVDELMALCDRLEAQQADAASAHAQLVQALLGSLIQASDATEFAANWQRLAEHFHTLFSTEPSIDALKKNLLQLAVMGKLVPQDPSEEPASELLKRIDEEKSSSVSGGRKRKQIVQPVIDDYEKAFKLPSGWDWVRLQQIISVSSGDGLVSADMNPAGGVPVYGGNGVTGYHDKQNIKKETLVIGRVGYYCGSIHLTPTNAWVTDNALIVNFSEGNLYKNFLFWLLKGTNLKEQENATAQPVISGRKIYPIVLAIPPLAEQHRIVAKVDQLMALCEQLKTQLSQAHQLNQQLASTLVEQAVA